MGVPERLRTSSLSFRKTVLYPFELPGHTETLSNIAPSTGVEPACVQLAFSCLEGRRHTRA